MEQPGTMVFETTDSLQKETPIALYVIYAPANMTTSPSSQMILLLLMPQNMMQPPKPKKGKGKGKGNRKYPYFQRCF